MVDLGSCFPTQAELGWGTHCRADCGFVKAAAGPLRLRYAALRMTMVDLGSCFPTQAELGWGTHCRADLKLRKGRCKSPSASLRCAQDDDG